MFWTSTCPSSGATTTAVAAFGLPSEFGDSSAVGRGRAGSTGPTTTNNTATTKLRGKPEAATAVVVAPDYEHEDAQTCPAVFK
jgi:hypothetical protein